MKLMNPKLAQMAAATAAANKPRSISPVRGGPLAGAVDNKPLPGGPKPMSGGSAQGLGAAMSGPKMGLGTAMGLKKMAGAGAALGKNFGMKSGGSVGSASKRADGIATKGKTKGRMC